MPAAKHVISVATSPDVALTSEALEDANGRYWFDTHARTLGAGAGMLEGGAIAVGIRALGSGRSVRKTYAGSRSLLGQIEDGGRIDPAAITTARAIRKALREIVHLDIRPGLMRQPAPLHAPQMGFSGENVAAVLHAMADSERADLVDWLSELCAPQISRIEFEVVEAVREVYFLLVEREGTRVSARSLSDGTLRFLGILVALLTAPEGSLILLEEPDVGLHPARIHLLAELLEAIPARRNIQVIATTHSPVLLAHLSAEALADVVAFDRAPESGLSVAARIGSLPHFDRLRDSAEREHLVATGWLERAL